VRQLHLGLLGLVVFFAVPMSSHAAEFPAEGGGGDRADRDVCDPGEFMVGARFRSGSWIDQIQIRCAPLDRSNGTLGSPHSGPRQPPRGGPTGGIGGSVTCPKNMWVTQMGFWFTAGNRQVRHVGMRCEFPSPNGRRESFIIFGSGQGGAGNPRHVCPRGEAAVGLNVRSGKHVNALGLVCSRVPSLGSAASKAK